MPVPLQRTGAVKFKNGSDVVKTQKQSVSGVLESANSRGRSTQQITHEKINTDYYQSNLGSSNGQHDLKYKQNLANQFKNQQDNKNSNNQSQPTKSSIKTNPHEFHSDMMVADWQSENKQSYNQNGGNQSYSENNQNRQVNDNDNQSFEPFNNREVMSESARQYPWPATTERVSATQAPVSRDPLLRGAYDEDMWRSEYEQRCATLKAKQKELLKAGGGVGEEFTAGVRSAAHGEMPRNYAWEGEEVGSKANGGDGASKVSSIPAAYNMGASESKLKYKWPQRQDSVLPAAPPADHLNIFRGAEHVEDDAYNQVRRESLSASNYVRHAPGDILRSAQDREDLAHREGEKNPVSFAWPSQQQHQNEGENHEGSRAFHHHNHRSSRDDYPRDAPYSEYTRKYYWKEGEGRGSSQSPDKKGDGADRLNLFEGQGGPGPVRESEYSRNFHQQDDEMDRLHSTRLHLPTAGVPSHTNPSCPTQFAWPGARGDLYGGDGEGGKRRPKHSRGYQDSDMRSEYTLKYQYVAPQTAADGQSRPAAKAPPPSSSAHLLGLDGGGVSSGGPGDNWQSEYEERFTALRQQQRALLRGAQQDEGEGHVAGVASERHDAYPVNYAWKEAPQVVVSSPPRRSLAAQTGRSEYEARFTYSGPAESGPHRGAETGGEGLNLFHDPSAAQGDNRRGDRSVSEYHAKYQPVSADQAGPQRGGAKGDTSDNPPQFAWAIVDGEVPAHPVLVRKSPSSGPPETSEYSSKYHWKEASSSSVGGALPPAGGASNAAISAASGGVFAGGLGEEGGSQGWASEYEVANAGVNHHVANTHQSAAGLTTTPHGAIPSFYAWPDLKADQPAIVRPASSIHIAPTLSEYESQFVRLSPPGDETTYGAVSPACEGLNLFAHGKGDGPGDSEYRARFLGDATTESTDAIRASTAGSASAPQAVSPAQFAWPLVDPERVKEQQNGQHRRGAETSEYDTRYGWPDLPPPPSLDASNGPRPHSSASDIFCAGGQVSSSAAAGAWQSEYDSRCVDLLARTHTPTYLKDSATARIAGVSTDRHAPMPSFCAWPEPPAPPPSVSRPDASSDDPPAHSEYEAQFVSKEIHRVASQKPSVGATGTQRAETNMFAVISGNSADLTTGETEYHAQFRGEEDDLMFSQQSSHAVNSSAPAQFAWSRIALKQQPVEERPSSRRQSLPFDEETEYDARFVWPKESETNACHALAKQRTSTTSTTNNLVGSSGKLQVRSSDWRSEYDARCADVLRRQRLEAEAQDVSKEKRNMVHGIHSAPAIEAPAFYAWRLPVPFHSAAYSQEDTHRSLDDAALCRRSHSAEPSRRHFSSSVSFPARPFVGQTEYTDKFSASTTKGRGRGYGDRGRRSSSVRPFRTIRDNVQDVAERSVSSHTHNDTADATAGTGISTSMTQDSLSRTNRAVGAASSSGLSSVTGAARFTSRPESGYFASTRILAESLPHSRRNLVKVPIPRPAQPSTEATSSYKWPKTRQTHIATVVRRGRAPGSSNRDREKENVPGTSNRLISAPQGLKLMRHSVASSLGDDFSQ